MHDFEGRTTMDSSSSGDVGLHLHPLGRSRGAYTNCIQLSAGVQSGGGALRVHV